MKKRWLLFVAGVSACASTEVLVSAPDPVTETLRPNDASTPPDALDADLDADAAACTDCDDFPATCSDGVLCLNGPFDPANPGKGLDLRTQINVIRGRAANDVWAAGALGALAHFDGASWTLSDPGVPETMRALWLRETAEISIGMLDRVYARGAPFEDGGASPSDGGWTVHTPSLPPIEDSPRNGRFTAAWAAPGAEWLWCTANAAEPGSSSGLWRLRQAPSSAFEVAVGISKNACSVTACSQLTSIHGSSADVLWAVGLGGASVRISGAEGDAPTVETLYTQTWNALNGVWSASDGEAWAVGAMGTIRHYTGSTLLWDVVSNVPTTVDLNAVWGLSSSDVWAVGDAGVVLHFDGTTWSRVKIAGLGARRPNLTTVWGAAPGHVWIGGQGVLLSLGGKP